MSEKTCEGCGGKCCRYVAIEIDCPEDLEDFENIKWYVIHENVQVYIEEDGTWNVEFLTPCKYVRGDGRCSIHEDFVENPEHIRPDICKEFSTENCPHHNDYKELFSFKNIGDVEEYIEKIFKKGLHRIPEEEEDEVED